MFFVFPRKHKQVHISRYQRSSTHTMSNLSQLPATSSSNNNHQQPVDSETIDQGQSAAGQVSGEQQINDRQPTNGEIASSENQQQQQQQLLTSIRSTMERNLNERTQSWRSNLSNVFQEIRPLVQHAQSVNNSNLFNTWMPQNNNNTLSSTNLTNVLSNSGRIASTDDLAAAAALANVAGNQYHNHHNQTSRTSSTLQSPNDSFIINLDGHNNIPTSSSTYATHQDNRFTGVVPNDTSNSILDSRRAQLLADLQPIRNNSNNNNALNGNAAVDLAGGGGVAGAGPPEDGPTAEAFAQIPEARALFTSLARYVPYICIILVKVSYDHLDSIIDFFALFITFSHANWVVRQEISKQAQRSILKLLRELLYIVLVIVVIGFMLEKKNLFFSVIFASSFTHPFTLRHLLFSIGVTDLILKLITVGVKIIITLMPPKIVDYKNRVIFFFFFFEY